MKKSIIVSSIIVLAISLTAFGLVNWKTPINDKEVISTSNLSITEGPTLPSTKNSPDFYYDVGTRFGAITKSEIDKARFVKDFLPKEKHDDIVDFKTVSVLVFNQDILAEKAEHSHENKLTSAQIKLLQSSEYSTNFRIYTEFIERNKVTNELQRNYAAPHLTIVPEQQAAYKDGKHKLLEYLKTSNEAFITNRNLELLKSAKLYFTINKNGSLTNFRLDRSCGYSDIDNAMIDLMKKAPGKWIPAKDVKGENVDQELVVSFGLVGC